MENYGLIILAIIVTWIIIIASLIGQHMDSKIEKLEEPKEKFCPPHKWSWEEQVGMENTYFIRCQRCRRLPGWDREV